MGDRILLKPYDTGWIRLR